MQLFPWRHRLRSRGPLGRRERKNGVCSSEASFDVLAPKAVKGRRAAKARSFVSFPSWEKKKGKMHCRLHTMLMVSNTKQNMGKLS